MRWCWILGVTISKNILKHLKNCLLPATSILCCIEKVACQICYIFVKLATLTKSHRARWRYAQHTCRHRVLYTSHPSRCLDRWDLNSAREKGKQPDPIVGVNSRMRQRRPKKEQKAALRDHDWPRTAREK